MKEKKLSSFAKVFVVAWFLIVLFYASVVILKAVPVRTRLVAKWQHKLKITLVRPDDHSFYIEDNMIKKLEEGYQSGSYQYDDDVISFYIGNESIDFEQTHIYLPEENDRELSEDEMRNWLNQVASTGELPAGTRLDKFDAKFGEQNGYNIRGTGKYKGFIAVSGGTAHIPISDTDGEEVHQKELEDAEAGAMAWVASLCLIMAGLSSGVFVFAAQKKEKALYVYGCWTLVGGALLFAFVGIVMTMVK